MAFFYFICWYIWVSLSISLIVIRWKIFASILGIALFIAASHFSFELARKRNESRYMFPFFISEAFLCAAIGCYIVTSGKLMLDMFTFLFAGGEYPVEDRWSWIWWDWDQKI